LYNAVGMRVKFVIAIIICFSLFLPKLFGCIYNVRDVGFVDTKSGPFSLYCFVRDDTPQEFISFFEQISNAALIDMNVEVEVIKIDQIKNHAALEYIQFMEIKSFPAAVLVSTKGRALVLPVSAPDRTFKKTVRSTLESIEASPIREEILYHIVKAYCVVLLIEGKEANKNKNIHEITSSARQKISRIMGQLPKRIEEPPHIIVVSQEMLSKERVLLWSLGIDENQPDEPHVAVIYGRGRKIGPLLIGDQITEARLYNILSVIGLSCECGLDRDWMMGTLIPLRWGTEVKSDVVKFLGFDAESPLVKMEISLILSLGASFAGEGAVKFNEGSPSLRVSPAELRKLQAASQKLTSSKFGSSLKILLFILVPIVILILAAGTLILIRARKKGS